MVLKSELLDLLIENKTNPNEILRLFSAHGFSPAELSDLNSNLSDKDPYSRCVLSSDPRCEVMLARWTPGFSCEPHNHGSSKGYVFYLEGSFLETHYRLAKGEMTEAGFRKHEAGDYTLVHAGEIHSCVSESGQAPGLSLHVYFPRIHAMQVYDRKMNRTLTVADDCGAWIPSDSRQIVIEQDWS